jgi:hypothetical protein
MGRATWVHYPRIKKSGPNHRHDPRQSDYPTDPCLLPLRFYSFRQHIPYSLRSIPLLPVKKLPV